MSSPRNSGAPYFSVSRPPKLWGLRWGCSLIMEQLLSGGNRGIYVCAQPAGSRIRSEWVHFAAIDPPPLAIGRLKARRVRACFNKSPLSCRDFSLGIMINSQWTCTHPAYRSFDCDRRRCAAARARDCVAPETSTTTTRLALTLDLRSGANPTTRRNDSGNSLLLLKTVSFIVASSP